MKAMVYHGPGKRAWEEVPKPVIVDDTDAIVRVDAVTICGTDLHILKGDVPTVTDGRILGHEAVEHAGKQGDVLPGYHHQVRGAGVLQQAPVPIPEARAISQHQRSEPAGPAPCIHLEQALAQLVTPGHRTAGRQQPLTGLYRAGRSDAPRQQPGFEIEGRRIHQAARPL